jgi:hypothetical protein
VTHRGDQTLRDEMWRHGFPADVIERTLSASFTSYGGDGGDVTLELVAPRETVTFHACTSPLSPRDIARLREKVPLPGVLGEWPRRRGDKPRGPWRERK